MPIIVTLDYEVFGNGAGDVMRDVIQPTDRLLRICERHGTRMTIMLEVGEYWAFERYDEQLRKALGYSPHEQMERQAIDAVRRGHDVQLHLHPQWIDAEYAMGTWRLHNAFWRLADMPGGLGHTSDPTSITGALLRGKQTLENMMKPVKSDYECVCFRAGGFYAQPSGPIIRAMKEVGLRADSSVVKGYKADSPFRVDYSHVQTGRHAWWTTETELTEEGRPGEHILEVCVSSRMEPYWKNFKLTKLRATMKRGRIENASSGRRDVDRSLRSVPRCGTVLRRVLKKHASTFDFCKLSATDMVKRVREHAGAAEQPVVLIGHSKDFFNDLALDRFLDRVKQGDHVVFQTLSEFVDKAIGSQRGR